MNADAVDITEQRVLQYEIVHAGGRQPEERLDVDRDVVEKKFVVGDFRILATDDQGCFGRLAEAVGLHPVARVRDFQAALIAVLRIRVIRKQRAEKVADNAVVHAAHGHRGPGRAEEMIALRQRASPDSRAAAVG
jgi:hypothetical protein